MKNISKLLIFTMLILLLSLGAISATENITDTSDSTLDITTKDTADISLDEGISDEANHDRNIEKKTSDTNICTNKEAQHIITVTNSTYDLYFKEIEKSEFVQTTDYIQAGDTVNLKGNFKDMKFAVDKNITFTSLDKDAKLEDCTVYVLGQNASGSTVSNLDIFNNGTLKKGIQVKDASHVVIEDNTIKTYGLRAYGFVADYMNYSTIRNNYFEREGDDWRYITFVIGLSFYNTIANNTLHTGAANGIYLSVYGSSEAEFVGGQCDYNNITGNKIYATGYVTSWCYTIQAMGAYNLIANNTVHGGFRGISTQDFENNLIIGNDVHAINEGIYACDGATVINNNVHVTESSIGITVGSDNVKIINNTITTESGEGIDIRGNFTLIANNTITSAEGIGIYSKGTNGHIIIENNKITSKKEGILFKQQTIFKKMNHVYVNRNTVISEEEYAINFKEVGSKNAEEVNVTVTGSNVLSSSRGTGTDAYLKPANSNDNPQFDSNQTLTVTQENYSQWFTGAVANDNILNNATVYLEGTFNNLSFTFNRKVHIIGENCKINNGTITLSADAHMSTITNISIKNTIKNTTVHGIDLLEVNNCKVTDVDIDNYAEYESFGIFLYGANGNTITNNTIKTSGDYVNNAIIAYSSDSNTISNNYININQSDIHVQYADSIMFNEKIGTIQEVLHNHGIILLYSSSNIINNNTVNATSMFDTYTFPTVECRNSLVGIDVYFNSHNNRISNNNVNVEGYGPYNYGIGVLGGYWGSPIASLSAINNVYESNNVKVQGGYFATGFIAGRNSLNTTVKNNNFTVDAYKNSTNRGDYSHGITLENSTSSNILSNIISCTASSIYVIEMFDSGNNTVTDNIMTANGTYPYGIAGTRSSENNIQNNSIIINKVNYGESSQATHGESIDAGDEGIMFMSQSTNNNIKYNEIKTNTDSTVKLTSETSNNNVTDNSLTANASVADQSVEDYGTSNIVRNNFVYFVNVTVDAFTAKTGETVTLTAHVFTTTNDVSNLTVAFKIGVTEVGTAKVSNGKSTLSYTIPTYFNPTTYQITASVSGNNFQNATNNNRANIGKDPEEITVKVNKVLATVGTDTTLTANLTTGVGGKIGTGQAEFYVDDTLVDTVDVRLGSASANYTVGNTSGVHIIRVKYLGTTDYAPAEANNTLGIQTKSMVSVANATGKLGEKVNIVANVTSGGDNIVNGIAHIYIGSYNVANATIINGRVNCSYTLANSFTSNVYNLRVEYDGNDTLTSATGSAKITVYPYTTVFSYNTTTVIVEENVSLVLGISNGKTGTEYYAANDGNVTIQINGQTLTDSNGNEIVGTVKSGIITFKFTAPAQMIGKHNITYTYSGNAKFEQLTKTYVNGLVIESNTIPTTITIDPLSPTKYGNNVTIKGTLKDRDSNPLKNIQIRLTVNSNTITTATNDKGIFTYTTTAITMGTNNVKANFTGNSNYDPSSTETTFLVNKQDTTINIDSIRAELNTVTITGTLKDTNGNAIKNAQIILTINTDTFNVTTNSSGVFTSSQTLTLSDINNVTALYEGSTSYATSSLKSTFTKDIQDTKITINPIAATTYTHNITITGTLTDKNNRILNNMPVTLSLNGEEIYLTTNSNGAYTYSGVTPTAGQNNITVSYAGNKDYNPCSATASFTVNKQNLNITINPIQSVVYGHNVTITGRLTDGDGNIRANSSLRITINGKNITTKTNNKGEFTVTSKVGVVGTNNVTASHNGDKNYNPTNTTATFTMNKQNLIITVNPIVATNYGNNVTITGRFTDGDGNARAKNELKININGKSLSATTDEEGYYTYTTSIGKLGTNNVTVSHAGGANYNPTEITATYEVVKQDLIITLDDLGTVSYGAVTITGRLTDGLGNPRANTGVKLLINGKSATAKTDSNGYFSFTTKVGKVGVNNITASHNGGGNYNPTSTNATFIMVKKDLKVTIDPIATVTYGDSVTITGTFTDGDGNIRANSSLKVIINGKTLTAKTDANGRFTATSKVASVGINNVTVAHSGGTGFNPTSTNTTFTMIKQDLIININQISNVKQGSTVTITGYFTDANGKIRANTNLKVNINGKDDTTKTDSNGVFTYTTTATTMGTNKVTISHAGGANYNPTNSTVTFTVTS